MINSFIVFIDEAGFMMSPVAQRTWAPRGQTPIMKISEPHGRISVIGAMAIRMEPRRFGFLFHAAPDNVNFHGYSIAEYLGHIHHRLNGQITVLWDSYGIHSAEPVSQYVATHRTISVEYFPPYAPELNPVDSIWAYIKSKRLANYCPRSLGELRRRVMTELFRVQMPDLLESFFRHTGLTLDR